MAKNKRERAVGYGYVIADAKGRIIHDTLRPNRSQCWFAFLGRVYEAGQKRLAKKEGFRCVPGFFRELEKK